jgi:hypothetical protein
LIPKSPRHTGALVLAAQEDTDKLRAELRRFYALPEYKPFRPLLERLEPYLTVGNRIGVVRQGLALTTALQQGQQGGVQTRSSMQDVAIGFVNEGLQAEGSIVQVQGDILLTLFQQALPEIKVPEPSVDVAFVLLAMIDSEAAALGSKTAFANEIPILEENFVSLENHLKASGCANWADNYAAAPEQWRPRGDRYIADHVREALAALNESGEFSKRLTAKFYDIRVLGSGRPQGRALVRRLRSSGCVVIVDAISLRHPALLRAYQRSLLDVFPSTSVLTLTPDVNSLQLMHGMVYALQISLQESEFGLRLKDPLEGFACRANSELDSIVPWLVERVRKIYASAAPLDGIRGQMQL